MKIICTAVCFLFIMLTTCHNLYSQINNEMYKDLDNRLKMLENSFENVNEYFIKVDNIESDFHKFTSEIKNTQKGNMEQLSSQTVNVNETNFDKRLKTMEYEVAGLKDRSALMDMTDEIRRVKEYVCKNGHVFQELSADKNCPVCGLKQKPRTVFKLFKFARRENVSERIGSAIDEEFEKRVLVAAGGTGIYQQILRNEGHENNFGEGSFDLLFISKPLLHTTFFVDLEAIGGNGPDEVIGSFSGLNDDSGSLQDDDEVDRVSVRETWLQSFLFPQRKLMVVAGKIDLTNYFDSNTVANDETTQFITSAFVNNPAMEVPENGPGFVAFFDTKRGAFFGLGLQSAENSGTNITDHLYGIAEIGYRSHLFLDQEGNYRIWGKINNEMDDNKGFGISVDQNLSTRLTAFARYGANEEKINESGIASAWSAGLRLRSPFFSRVNDQVAFAFGSLDITGGDEESVAELYYRFQFNEHFAVTPNFQALFDPAGIGEMDTVELVGIRTQIEF